MFIGSVAESTFKSLTNEGVTGARNKGKAHGPSSAKHDAVTLGSAGTIARGVEAARNSSGVDEAKVAKFRESIQNGTFKVNAESVASKMIESETGLGSILRR